jgi:hypothetical protein
MIGTLIRNWWMLAISSVLDVIISVIYFNHAGNGFHASKDVIFLGELTIAVGACTIVAGVWRPATGSCWLLVLNGLALVALGLIFSTLFGSRIRFRTVAMLIILMAMSMALLELAAMRNLWRRRDVVDGWLLAIAGAGSLGFAVAFFALGFGWVKIQPGSFPDLLWLGSYFAFSALCILGTGLRLDALRAVIDSPPAASGDSPSRRISLRKRATSPLVSVR